MRYAWDLVTGPDWGHYFDEQSPGYTYATPLDALRAAVAVAHANGFNMGETGVYVYGDDGEQTAWSWSGAYPSILYGMDGTAENIAVVDQLTLEVGVS